MSSLRSLLVGIAVGAALGCGLVLAVDREPSVTIDNGVLDGWVVTRDNESLVCTNPIAFIRAKQIECD
jgi:hypothetical protein